MERMLSEQEEIDLRMFFEESAIWRYNSKKGADVKTVDQLAFLMANKAVREWWNAFGDKKSDDPEMATDGFQDLCSHDVKMSYQTLLSDCYRAVLGSRQRVHVRLGDILRRCDADSLLKGFAEPFVAIADVYLRQAWDVLETFPRGERLPPTEMFYDSSSPAN